MSCSYKSSEGSIHMLISQQLFDHQEAGRFTYSSLGLEAVSMESTILCKLGNMVQCQEDVGKGYAGAVFDLKLWAYFHCLCIVQCLFTRIECPWKMLPGQ